MRTLSLAIIAMLCMAIKPQVSKPTEYQSLITQNKARWWALVADDNDDLPLWKFADSSSTGITAECACSAITAVTGQSVGISRSSTATCTKGGYGLRTNNINTGDLIECASNTPRVETNNSGVRGLRVDPTRSNLLLRFIEYCNGAWTDVATPTTTGTGCPITVAQTSPWAATYSTSAVLIDDNDAAAREGKQQSITVVSGQPHTMSCLVQAVTLNSAAISLDGTVATITGLSTTSYSIIEVTDVSSSGTSITAQILNGAATSDTGTVRWGGCQVEAGLFRTAIIPTTSAIATRASELPASVVSGMSGGNNASMSIDIDGFRGEITYPTPLAIQPAVMGDRGLFTSPPGTGETQARCYASNDATSAGATSTVTLSGVHLWCASQPSGVDGYWGNTMTTSSALTGTFSNITQITIGVSNTNISLTATRGIYTNGCVHPTYARCR